MKKIVTSPLFWIVILSALPLWALLIPGLPVTHDGVDHVARIANFYQSLKEGNSIPRWAANLNWGYGHPILMFLYPLPSYFASLFHFLGMSFVNSTKLVFGLTMILSGVFMYLWLRDAFGKTAGLVGGLLYVFAPYRFVDIYVRGALGEHVAFMFPPIILYFLRKRSFVGFSISLGALILSHNAIALMFMPIIGLYGLYLLLFEVKNKIQFALYFLLFTVLGFGLSAFFWIPAFFEGKYTLRDIVTSGEAVSRFVPWSWFIYSPWNYGQGDTLTKSLGIMQWLGIIAALVMVRKTKLVNVRAILLCTLGILLLSLFIMTSWSRPLWYSLTILQKFQFPWRFLSVSVFAAALLGGMAFGKSKKIFLIPYAALIILVSIPMWHPKAYVMHDESFYTGIYLSTTDTGESSPIWSVRFMEHTPANPIQVISGEALIEAGFRSTTRHQYNIDAKKSSRIVENTLYFPQWRVYIDGIPTGIEFQDPGYRGLITFWITPGRHNVVVVFENTKLRTAAEQISLASLGIIGCIVIGAYLWEKRK